MADDRFVILRRECNCSVKKKRIKQMLELEILEKLFKYYYQLKTSVEYNYQLKLVEYNY